MSDGGKIIDFASAKARIEEKSLLERRELQKVQKRIQSLRERNLLQAKERTRECVEYLWDLLEDPLVLGDPENWTEEGIELATHLRDHLTCIADTYLGDESPFTWATDDEEEDDD